jgi:sugar phosphate permease
MTLLMTMLMNDDDVILLTGMMTLCVDTQESPPTVTGTVSGVVGMLSYFGAALSGAPLAATMQVCALCCAGLCSYLYLLCALIRFV